MARALLDPLHTPLHSAASVTAVGIEPHIRSIRDESLVTRERHREPRTTADPNAAPA
jgi:hypothetical protein